MCLCRCKTIDLFVGFRMGDLNGGVVLIRQTSHIKSLFVIMLHQIWNFRHSRHLRIINCVGIQPFSLAINLNVVSSFNVFYTLISILRCNVLLFRINKNFFFKKKIPLW